jgi:hypothetical protein
MGTAGTAKWGQCSCRTTTPYRGGGWGTAECRVSKSGAAKSVSIYFDEFLGLSFFVLTLDFDQRPGCQPELQHCEYLCLVALVLGVQVQSAGYSISDPF